MHKTHCNYNYALRLHLICWLNVTQSRYSQYFCITDPSLAVVMHRACYLWSSTSYIIISIKYCYYYIKSQSYPSNLVKRSGFEHQLALIPRGVETRVDPMKNFSGIRSSIAEGHGGFESLIWLPRFRVVATAPRVLEFTTKHHHTDKKAMANGCPKILRLKAFL